ncbi:hypothetical protein [Pseudoalteromonas sp. Z1A8]|uniref:hypothetical protein n=1 Tax=Pseudoalteromonas sp. Z1A8 TaxID=2686354 RepID=UPI00140BDD15|nr:hypothetical protein [Pseudoalteromonas sp. Z1A8]
MTLISISQDIPLSIYNFHVFYISTAAIILFIALLLHKDYSLKRSMLYTFASFITFYFFAYSAADRYYKLERMGDKLNLSYISPHKDKSILITEIKSMSFGSSNRSGSGCFVSIKLFNGDSYKSSAIQEGTDYCKQKRKELMSVLNIKANKSLKQDK